jgi:hypothetical protein
VIVGPPSSNKTPALKAAFALLQQAEDRMALGFDEQMTAYKTRAVFAAAKHAAWKEEVAKAVKHGDPAPPMPADAEEPEAPVQPRIKVADATIEKLAALAASLPVVCCWCATSLRAGLEGSIATAAPGLTEHLRSRCTTAAPTPLIG